MLERTFPQGVQRDVAVASRLRIAVVIATLGRPKEVAELLDALTRQTHPASAIVISATSPEDLPAEIPAVAQVVLGPKGLPAQRNRGMAPVLGSCDLIAFFDDDYLPSLRALQGISALFERYPDVAGANGHLLADGIGSAGLGHGEALKLVEAYDRAPPPEPAILKEGRRLYGCNMVFRVCAIGPVRFDENLPLYGWQEDVDFAAQMSARGRIVTSQAFAGVHRGVTSGRLGGARLGYSQIANPVYLARKGTIDLSHAAALMVRNLIANHVRALWPEPWVDRIGRLRGNWLALRHLVTGRIDPRRVLDM